MESAKAPMVRAGWRGYLRAAAVLGCCLALSVGWLMHRVHAQLGERALEVGRQLEQTSGVHAGTTHLTLNGGQLALNSSSTRAPVQDVLDRFAGLCRRDDARLDESLARVRANADLPSGVAWDRLGVLRSVSPRGEGVAACFVNKDVKTGGLSQLLEGLAQAVSTGSLEKLGQFRYVFARVSKETGATHVLSAWSEGVLNAHAMFPEQGDVPGADLVAGVRPPSAVRIIAAQVEGSRFQTAMYESTSSPEQAMRSYERALLARGYVALAAPALDAASPIPTRVFTLGDQDSLVVLAQPSDDKTLLSTFRLGSSKSVVLSSGGGL
jgi:hypothetical protein